MAIVTSSFVNQDTIAHRVADATAKLPPDVVRIRYNLGQDWSGESAVFFRVLIKDSSGNMPRLSEVARDVRDTMYREVRPYELGLQAYFNFRGESEQEFLKEKGWA